MSRCVSALQRFKVCASFHIPTAPMLLKLRSRWTSAVHFSTTLAIASMPISSMRLLLRSRWVRASHFPKTASSVAAPSLPSAQLRYATKPCRAAPHALSDNALASTAAHPPHRRVTACCRTRRRSSTTSSSFTFALRLFTRRILPEESSSSRRCLHTLNPATTRSAGQTRATIPDGNESRGLLICAIFSSDFVELANAGQASQPRALTEAWSAAEDLQCLPLPK
eukprot:3881825-Rhodomonas_salina.1